ncbi:MAG: hypothetical protein A2X13_13995 [Bacteroidetes bacterium GWC2_33_15]|nr:MAG: hypothetical protein A2X10_09210 [Bacteroidetes bacterium GWA2_33_15]OFX50455.1 MAG: hypothetical protein A2X13_13995 [Bacteroidetes bacterium GWC2_33_15]OFX66627.1 MAG: hypothetical protein A2X15_07880 [Bacteroidetes bacterium GWB2_32_14]OFX69245.1 MAG: hypothetical protein A2X14_08810 [Bacteroidetes bacterium GWD2_33_33]HAN18558.1 hypothetical protein [Bacteroidales bacterium]
MKNLFLPLFFLFGISVSAQESTNISPGKRYPVFVGFEGGFNLTQSDSYEDKYLNEFLGLSFDFFFSKNRSIKTKVKYVKVNCITDSWNWSDFSGEKDAIYNAEFILIPVLYKWQFGKSDSKGYIQGGLFFALETETEYLNYPDDYEKKSSDIGLNLGAGVQFPLFFKNLNFYGEFEILQGTFKKIPVETANVSPISIEKSLTSILLSFGFKYKF